VAHTSARKKREVSCPYDRCPYERTFEMLKRSLTELSERVSCLQVESRWVKRLVFAELMILVGVLLALIS